MRTPLVVVTGIDAQAMDAAAVGLAWDLPNAVAVQHRIDPESQVLSRVVSDATGVLDRAEVALEHACVSCALREDILPTLERLAREQRWSTLVACLPVGAEAENLGGALARDSRLARQLRLTSVVTALAGAGLAEDLLGGDLLSERDAHSNPWDERGVAEVACGQVEYADVVAVSGPADQEGLDLLRALARRDTVLVDGTENLRAEVLLEPRHDHRQTTSWRSPLRERPTAPLQAGRAWQLELSSPRPFHPERLVEGVERLADGRFRARGAFWVPTRPQMALHWDGAGGHLSFATYGPWGRRTPETRLLFTGLGVPPETLRPAFEDMLVSHEEALLAASRPRETYDGLEPWLGEIGEVA